MTKPGDDKNSWKPGDLRKRLKRGENAVLIDVRSADEFAQAYIDGAINIPADN